MSDQKEKVLVSTKFKHRPKTVRNYYNVNGVSYTTLSNATKSVVESPLDVAGDGFAVMDLRNDNWNMGSC